MTRVAVVVPAHNESAVLHRCVQALSRAASVVAVPVRIVVVLDGCDDDSITLGDRFGPDVEFIEVDGRNVGAARAAGFTHARSALGITGARSWYATTDADTEVSADWLERQLCSDADVVLGVVHVDQWRHYPDAVADQYEARYNDGQPGHRHIHGANMGFRADAYWRVHGFAPLASGEDVDLVQRFQGAGCRIDWNDGLSVATSDRRAGRAPRGFADHLADVSREILAQSGGAGS